jgi:molybdopterin/thiamine biosynthesis adenylyltransferase
MESAKISLGIKKTRNLEKAIKKCEICRKRRAKFVCIKCNRRACSLCYFSILGLCRKCISPEVVEKWKSESTDWKKILNIEWID